MDTSIIWIKTPGGKMKKTFLKSALLAVAGISMLAGNAWSLTLPATPELQAALDERTNDGSSSIDVYSDMLGDISDSVWEFTASSTGGVTLLFEFSGNAMNNTFGHCCPNVFYSRQRNLLIY